MSTRARYWWSITVYGCHVVTGWSGPGSSTRPGQPKAGDPS